MKSYLSLIVAFFLLISCNKKIEVKGNIKNANPLDRIEVIEASGVATLPLINIPIDEKGHFNASFDAPKNGMYLFAYAGKATMLYLKKGQSLELSGDASSFPETNQIKGEAKPNNDFLKKADESFLSYANKIDVQKLIETDEPKFIKDFNKILTDLTKQIDDFGTKYKADAEVINYKKMDTNAKLIGLIDLYEKSHALTTKNKSYKPSAKFTELKKALINDEEKMVKEIPAYRQFLLGTLNNDFQKFAQPKMLSSQQTPLTSELFTDFMKEKKEFSQTVKDYLFSFIIANDINYENIKKYDKITKLIDENIKDNTIKDNLKELQKVLMGFKEGTAPDLALQNEDGSNTNLKDLKGKPTLVVFYASYNPNIAFTLVPQLKELNDTYKSKLNFAYINLDDTQDQFKKTSSSLLKGLSGSNYFVKDGINSPDAKKFGLYAFKIPSIILIDKDGKLSGRPYFGIDENFTNQLEKLTGIKAPSQAPPAEISPLPTEKAPSQQPEQAK